ncbi:MAG: hypothetical protein HYU56_01620 [Candidatus Aenigmarchaeota archaeon]|nr:hypothetical protein [Candidatus Aenigmarchaeota archaeon]
MKGSVPFNIGSGGKKKFLITFDREGCIGAFSCSAVDEKLWEKVPEEGKVNLFGAVLNESGLYEIVLEEGQFSPDAETVCPVNVIKIKEITEEEADEWKRKYNL